MRLVALWAALALAGTLPGASATAQAPVATQPLAPGEVLLELNASGSVTTRADIAVMTIRATAEGNTNAEARQAVAAEVARLTAVARQAGVAPADIRVGDSMIGPSFDMLETPPPLFDVAEANASAGEGPMTGPPPRAASAHALIAIRGRDVARLAPMLRALEEAHALVDSMPAYSLNDTDTPRREARNRALARARADAEAYAAALGMRVVRVVRVTERLGFDFVSMMMNERAMRRQLEGSENRGPDIETSVTIGVDFALAPR
ncbi:MAG TPA: SIMPL domain-containing protein [Allosphingosinicella sp.]|nr:SIMPL domain-containing protein [Allosphingosinicella sp.]